MRTLERVAHAALHAVRSSWSQPPARRSRRWLCVLALALSGCASHEHATPRAFEADPERVPEAYTRSTAPLAWPAATRAFQITPEGDFYNGAWYVRVRASVIETGGEVAAAPPRVIAFEDRWRPIAHWVRHDGAVRWDFEAVASPAANDTNLFVSVLARATNDSTAPSRVRLALAFAPPDSNVAFVAWDAPDSEAASAGAAAEIPTWASERGGEAAAGLSHAGSGGSEIRVESTLPAHGVLEKRFVLSAYPRPARELAAFDRVPHPTRVADTRTWWDRETARGTRFELGDPELEHAIAGALVTLLTCRERRGADWFPVGGPFQYRDVYLRDGARAIHALAVMGYAGEALELAAGLRSLQWPSGAFLTQRGQPDGTGQALWAFEQAALRGAPRDSVGAFADAAARAWRWCESQRRAMAEIDPRHRPLMPFADPRDNELARAQLTGTDAWTIAGYRSAARLAAAAGRAALADSIEASRRAYVAAFMRSLAASRSSDVPAAWDGDARDWGNIAALYPCRAGDAAAADSAMWERRCGALARRLWGNGESGLLAYGAADSLHSYLGTDLGQWALLADDRVAFERVIDGLLRWRSASGGWAEHFSSSRRDYGHNLPPHPTAAAGLVALVRNSLVYDDGPRLMLTLGARGAWWRGGKVHAAPTRWGVIDLAFARHGDVAEWSWSPVAIPTVLRLPPGTAVAAIDAPLQGVVGGDEVVAMPGTSHASVRLVQSAAASAATRGAR